MNRAGRLLALAALWTVAAAASPAPVVAPPPDLSRLIPFVESPQSKPPVGLPEIAAPPAPIDLTMPPVVKTAWPVAERPIAPIRASGGAPCVAALFPFAAQSLECGRDRFLEKKYADAAKSLDESVRRAGREQQLVAQEARYWLAESLIRQGQFERADLVLRQVVVESVRTEWELWSTHTAGWLALRAGDFTRARDAFSRLLAGALPVVLQGWARYGLALAYYGLGQYAEAERAWADLAQRGVPREIQREYAFWAGETASRVGNHARAAQELGAFVAAGEHPLRGIGRIRLGWAALAAGRGPESVAAFRDYLAAARAGGNATEVEWAETGLALALGTAGDWDAAVAATRALLARNTPASIPVTLRLVRQGAAAGKATAVEALVQELLPRSLTPPVRAWLLLLKGDADRAAGNRDEARTQYDLAQKVEPSSMIAQHAQLRLARTNFEMREYGQAVSDITALLPGLQSPDMRLPALLLQAESAYHAGNFGVAEAAYRRVLVEFPSYPSVPAIKRSLAWVALRQEQRAESRQLFLDFARGSTDAASTADAYVLATELALADGDLQAAGRELDRIISAYPTQPRTDFARMNRALLRLRSGQAAEAEPVLRDLITRAPFQALLGRAHAALAVALLALQKPTDAERHFMIAQREGAGALATLGVGSAMLMRGRMDEAAKRFAEAREQGTADVVAVADYGLGAVAIAKGKPAEFKQPAQVALKSSPTGPAAPRLHYALAAIAVEEKDWPAALDHARTLAAQFPRDDMADDALARAGAGAAQAQVWPVAYEAYSLLRQQYPTSPFAAPAVLPLAEAQLNTGRAADARRALEQAVGSSSVVATEPRSWVVLARAREATGDRRGALDAYARATRDAKASDEFMREAQLAQSRLLVSEQRWDQARVVLDRLLKSPDQAVVTEAAFSMGETFRQEGDPLGAAEYYMTAAYLAPESAFGRKAMLAAAQTFAASKQPDAAAVVFKKLLAQSNLPSDVADAARQGLQSLGR